MGIEGRARKFKMMKLTTASILVLLALCAMLLLVRGEVGPQALWGPGTYPELPNGFWPSYGHGGRRCPPGEIFKTCASSTCGEKKCYQLGLGGLRPCTLDCRTGCFCKPRLHRNNRGRCVRRKQCPKGRPRPKPHPTGRPE
uniref:Putative tick til 11 n=1 Tax=Amblyomma americanum TaxID=6943 RepID=A0A0C9SF03_AMBAM